MNPYVGFSLILTTTKKRNDQPHFNHRFLPLLGVFHTRIFFYNHLNFWGTGNCLYVLESWLRFKIGFQIYTISWLYTVINLTNIPVIHIHIYVRGFFLLSGSDKTSHPWVCLLNTNTTAKEPTNYPIYGLQNKQLS